MTRDEEPGLARVAALVSGDAPEAVFAAAAAELAQVTDPDSGEVHSVMAFIVRYEADATFTVLDYCGVNTHAIPRSSRWPLEGPSVVVQAFETLRPARIDDFAELPGVFGSLARSTGVTSSVGVPITIEGAPWGAISVNARERLPDGIETRIAAFARLIATAVDNADERVTARRLGEEQAALRRMATLVGRDVPQAELFAAVAGEVGRLLGADAASLIRYGPGELGRVMAWWVPPGGGRVPIAHTWPAQADRSTRIVPSRQTVRVDDWGRVHGTVAEYVHDELGIRSSLGSPVIVNEQAWGSLVVHSLSEPFPADAEFRLMSFAELVATTITNAESRAEVRRLADRQEALRRVATLVASQPSGLKVFSTVVEEVSRVLGFDATWLLRFLPDDTALNMACWPPDALTPGTVLRLDGDSVSARVIRSRQAARIEDYSSVEGSFATTAKATGMLAAAGAPVIVDGRVWGALIGGTTGLQPLADGVEARVEEFSALVATAISNVEARAEVTRLADRQAALRRVATLVARQTSPHEVFSTVVEELGRVLGFDVTRLLRYERSATATHVVSWPPDDMKPGAVLPLDGDSATARIRRTGRPTRVEDFTSVEGTIADRGRARGAVASVGAPILVEGSLWGVLLVVSNERAPMPDDTESRIEEFAALVANAIANVEARAEVDRLADEQAALRRVATLVASQPSAEEVFEVVVQEVGRLLAVDETRLIRFEPDGSGTMVSGWPAGGAVPVGTNRPLDGDNLSARIREAWAPARFDDYAAASGEFAAHVHALGTRAAAGAPIIVDGRLWGTLLATSRRPMSLAPGIESRIEEFTALVATAISNVEARAALAASRRRIVVATDDARRRFERDLHDGAQQRLVRLALELRLAEDEAGPELRRRIAQAVDGITDVLADLRELSSGLHPAILSEGGLRPALRALAHRSAVPVRLAEELDERFEERVEVAAYYVVSEALANAAKHAGASVVEVSVAHRGGRLCVAIRDDGSGGADATKGSGLVGLSDRVEALGGTIAITSARAAGTAIDVELPL